MFNLPLILFQINIILSRLTLVFLVLLHWLQKQRVILLQKLQQKSLWDIICTKLKTRLQENLQRLSLQLIML